MATNSTATLPDEILTIYSYEAILEAQPLFTFRNFVDVKEEAMVEPGNTIQFLKLDNIAKGQRLANEFTKVPRQLLSTSTVNIVMYEFANAVEFTRYLTQSSYRDVLQDGAVLLGRDYAQVLDDYLRDAYLATSNVQYAGGAGNDAGISTTSYFNTAEIKDAVESLKTMNAPMMYRGGDAFYVCVAHPHQLRKLRDDTAWQRAREYVDPSNIYRGEVGRYENVIFIETTQMPTTASAINGGTGTAYSASMFGEKVVGYGESVPMELVTDGPADFGRHLSLGWYGIWGAGIINDYAIEIRTA